MYYNLYLQKYEARTLFTWATWITIFANVLSVFFAFRWNVYLGISDTLFFLFTETVIGALGLALYFLPMMVVFAKITPQNIEGTCFAFLTGTFNFSNHVIAPLVGTSINQLFF